MKSKKQLIKEEAHHQDSQISQDPNNYIHNTFEQWIRSRAAHAYASVFTKHNKRQLKVLDIGTGTGGNAFRIAKEGHHVTTIDISPKSLEFTRNYFRAHGIESLLQTELSDGYDFLCNAKQGEFDIISGSNVLHHLPEVELAIEQIANLNPKAVAFLEPIGTNPVYQIIRWYLARFASSHTIDEEPFKGKFLNKIRALFPGVKITFLGAATPSNFLKNTPLKYIDDPISNSPLIWRLSKKCSICWEQS